MEFRYTEQIKAIRISWIDVCRGIAIIFVLYGHLLASDNSRYLLYSFHIPLFFFLSGLVFKPNFTKPFSFIVLKNIRQLLVPYFFFAILTYIFALVSQTAGDVSPGGITYQFFGMLYGNGNNGMLGYNVVLWFLPCLFITRLTFAFLIRKFSYSQRLFKMILLSAVSGYFLSLFFPWIRLPFGFETALTSIVFFGAGYFWKHTSYMKLRPRRYKLSFALVAMICTIIFATIDYRITGSQIDLRVNELGNFPFFYLAAFSGIISWVIISQLITRNAILEYIGRHSMILFAWHNILLVDLRLLVATFINARVIDTIKGILPFLYICTAISIILFSRFLVEKLKGIYRMPNLSK